MEIYKKKTDKQKGKNPYDVSESRIGEPRGIHDALRSLDF